MGWRRVWRDVRLRRPAFDLVADPDHPIWYRGRPYPVEGLPVGEELRGEVRAWAADPSPDLGADLADRLASAMRAPVVHDRSIHRPPA